MISSAISWGCVVIFTITPTMLHFVREGPCDSECCHYIELPCWAALPMTFGQNFRDSVFTKTQDVVEDLQAYLVSLEEVFFSEVYSQFLKSLQDDVSFVFQLVVQNKNRPNLFKLTNEPHAHELWRVLPDAVTITDVKTYGELVFSALLCCREPISVIETHWIRNSLETW